MCVHTCKSGCSWLWSEKVLILLLLPFGKDFFFFFNVYVCFAHMYSVYHMHAVPAQVTRGLGTGTADSCELPCIFRELTLNLL